MKVLFLWAAALGCLLLSGCAAAVGTAGGTYVPKDAAATCMSHCADIGLALDSVVIMANNVGCVCRGSRGTPQTGERSSAAGGMAALIVQEQARQQQQSHR